MMDVETVLTLVPGSEYNGGIVEEVMCYYDGDGVIVSWEVKVRHVVDVRPLMKMVWNR